MTPLISVVSGTFQRLEYLRAMMNSVRSQLPPNFPLEFSICDGGSTDGTLEWLRDQPDVVLTEHGELKGAIRAFTDAGNAAHGEFCIIANDDVVFQPNSILTALVYLETHPDCGGVAYADDRPAPGYPQNVFKTQTIPVEVNGRSVSLPYAQVGMFRTWLAKEIGFWGADDPIMGQGRTYGADNWLSARCYELGYTIDAVNTCRVSDRVPQDGLRAINDDAERKNPGVYYKAYPAPPIKAEYPVIPNPQNEHLRILLATLYDRGHGHYKHGLRDAFQKVGWTIEVDWLAAPDQLLSVARSWQPHVIFTQMNDPALMSHLRSLAPSAVIVNWFGDVWAETLTAPRMMQQSQYVDLQLVVNADVLPIYHARGINAAYWQVAAEPVPDVLPDMPAHDIVFLANAYSPARKELGRVLKEMNANVGLYGSDWNELGSGDTLYNFSAGAALYRNSRIAIGDNQYRDRGFVSNRLFEALGNGAFLLHQQIPGLEEFTGLIDGVHYVSWNDYEDLRAKVQSYLKNDKARKKIAAAGEKFVREHHSFDERVRELFEDLLPRIADGSPVTMADVVVEYGGADGILR